MARPGWRKQLAESRVIDHISIGVLSRTFTKGVVDLILVACG